MTRTRASERLWPWLIVVGCVAWHLWGLADGWRRVPPDWAGDFASYYYAVGSAGSEASPYDPRALERLSRADGYRHAVFPFIYPPLALPLMAWSVPFTLGTAFRVWFAFNYVLAGWIGFCLWRWWTPRDARAGPLVVGSLAALYPVLNGLFQGQTNLLVLALTLTALWQTERRPVLAGVLIAIAAMSKVAPVLFVGWWALHRRWRAAAAAVAAAPLLALCALPWASFAVQVDYFSRILPAVGAGRYEAVEVPLEIFGNWSPAAGFAGAFPSGTPAPSPAAHAGAVAVALAVVGLLAWTCRRRPADRRTEAAQASAIAVGLLLLPAYTFEHHLVWVLPGLVLLGLEVWQRQSSWGARLAYAAAWITLAVPLMQLRRLFEIVKDVAPAAPLLQHFKLAGMLILFAACVWLARATQMARQD